MKYFLPTMVAFGFILVGCNNEGASSDSSAIPGVVLSDAEVKASKVDASKTIEKPEIVTEGPLPKAVAEKTEFNFGRMALGSKSKTTFEIRNEGEGDLKLKAGEPTCQCTLFSLSKETVAPGESSILTISWNAKMVDRNFQHGGPVYTNDPERESINFVVMGRVGIDYEMQPTEMWNAGDTSEGGHAEVEGIIFSAIYSDFEIDRIETDVDYITSEVEELGGQDLAEINGLRGYKIRLVVAPEFPPGEVEQSFRIFLKGRTDPIGGVVSARRLGPIRILPTPGVTYTEKDKRLRLGTFPSSVGKEVDVMLLVDKLDKPLELTKIDVAPPFVSVDLSPIGTGNKRYRLRISVPAGVQRGLRTLDNPVRVRLQTNHPQHQSIELDVTYRAS